MDVLRQHGFCDDGGGRFPPRDPLSSPISSAVSPSRYDRQCEVFFWRGQGNEEVDFVVKEGLRVTRLIQVCWDMRSPATRHREVRSLLQASKALSCDDLVILTAAATGEEQVEWYGTRRTIRLVPMSEWIP